VQQTPAGEAAPICPHRGCASPLDVSGHHAVTCKHGPDVMARHHQLARCVAQYCAAAGLQAVAEQGGTRGHDASRPADVLVSPWPGGKPAAFDLTVRSPHRQDIVHLAGLHGGAAAARGEADKHARNDAKCQVAGWVCIPLAVETYGSWGAEATTALRELAGFSAMRSGVSKSHATTELFGRLGVALARSIGNACLARCSFGLGAEAVHDAVHPGRDRGRGG
jgi:hypothetical protein